MAIKGLSIPICGTYSTNKGTVTYADPVIADKAVEYSVTITKSENKALYGDNNVAENDKGTFQSGELELTTTDLTQEVSNKILGSKIVQLGTAGKQIQEEVFDDDLDTPYLGFGVIEWHQVNDIDKYKAIFFPKIRFDIPDGAATTKAEQVEWQTSKIKAQIMRSDDVSGDYVHPWRISAWFETEVDAVDYLLKKCGKVTA